MCFVLTKRAAMMHETDSTIVHILPQTQWVAALSLLLLRRKKGLTRAFLITVMIKGKESILTHVSKGIAQHDHEDSSKFSCPWQWSTDRKPRAQARSRTRL